MAYIPCMLKFCFSLCNSHFFMQIMTNKIFYIYFAISPLLCIVSLYINGLLGRIVPEAETWPRHCGRSGPRSAAQTWPSHRLTAGSSHPCQENIQEEGDQKGPYITLPPDILRHCPNQEFKKKGKKREKSFKCNLFFKCLAFV